VRIFTWTFRVIVIAFFTIIWWLTQVFKIWGIFMRMKLLLPILLIRLITRIIPLFWTVMSWLIWSTLMVFTSVLLMSMIFLSLAVLGSSGSFNYILPYVIVSPVIWEILRFFYIIVGLIIMMPALLALLILCLSFRSVFGLVELWSIVSRGLSLRQLIMALVFLYCFTLRHVFLCKKSLVFHVFVLSRLLSTKDSTFSSLRQLIFRIFFVIAKVLCSDIVVALELFHLLLIIVFQVFIFIQRLLSLL